MANATSEPIFSTEDGQIANDGSALPQVSILMLTCNRPQFLSTAIQSVIDQDFQDWELIVVHDGPNAPTTAVMEEWSDRDPRIRYFHRDRRGNIANATNFGLSKARGQYVAVLDDDDRWVPRNKLNKQVTFMSDNPQYVACGAGMTVVNDRGEVLMSYLKPEEDVEINAIALCANPMAHSTTMFRRDVAQSVGFYDESLAGFQDWDLWLRLGKCGKLYNFPEVFTRYTLWPGGGSFQQQRANALSAMKIVFRHRQEYSGFAGAMVLVSLHFAYAHLPAWMRKLSFSFLSRLKKRVFSRNSESLPMSRIPDKPNQESSPV